MTTRRVQPGFTPYLRDRILDHLLLGAIFVPPETIWLGLLLSPPDGEVEASEYRRQAVELTRAEDGRAANASDIMFPEPAGEWGEIVGAALYDAERRGNQLAWDYLDEPTEGTPRRITMIPKGGLRIGILPESGEAL